jgi:hypothetical protein
MNRLNLILPAGLLLCGCAHWEENRPANIPSATPQKLEARNNAASLLYDLLGDEKNVSKILIIKGNSEELGQLIRAISKSAAEDEGQLKTLASNDPALDLHDLQLPPGEKAAREAIAKTKEQKLLFSTGKEFEFNLLLTQTEALNYGWHLAKIAGENSSSPGEVQTFTAMSRQMEDLYNQVIREMRPDQK